MSRSLGLVSTTDDKAQWKPSSLPRATRPRPGAEVSISCARAAQERPGRLSTPRAGALHLVRAQTFRGKMTTSPLAERSTRGSPSVSRHVKGGNVTSFSPGYCAAAVSGPWASGSHAGHARTCSSVWACGCMCGVVRARLEEGVVAEGEGGGFTHQGPGTAPPPLLVGSGCLGPRHEGDAGAAACGRGRVAHHR